MLSAALLSLLVCAEEAAPSPSADGGALASSDPACRAVELERLLGDEGLGLEEKRAALTQCAPALAAGDGGAQLSAVLERTAPEAHRAALCLALRTLVRQWTAAMASGSFWIEGPSGSEPPLHQSICVGNAKGGSRCYSFGVSKEHPLGVVYRDVERGGDIQRYAESTPEQDAMAIDYLEKVASFESESRVYGAGSTCRGYSQDMYKELLSLLTADCGACSRSPPAVETAAPARTPAQRDGVVGWLVKRYTSTSP